MRKKLFGDQPVKMVGLSIPTDLYKALKVSAVMQDITITELLARYIEQGLERERGKR